MITAEDIARNRKVLNGEAPSGREFVKGSDGKFHDANAQTSAAPAPSPWPYMFGFGQPSPNASRPDDWRKGQASVPIKDILTGRK